MYTWSSSSHTNTVLVTLKTLETNINVMKIEPPQILMILQVTNNKKFKKRAHFYKRYCVNRFFKVRKKMHLPR